MNSRPSPLCGEKMYCAQNGRYWGAIVGGAPATRAWKKGVNVVINFYWKRTCLWWKVLRSDCYGLQATRAWKKGVNVVINFLLKKNLSSTLSTKQNRSIEERLLGLQQQLCYGRKDKMSSSIFLKKEPAFNTVNKFTKQITGLFKLSLIRSSTRRCLCFLV